MKLHYYSDNFDYKAEAQLMREYYKAGESDPATREALERLSYDEYIAIMPLYYRDGLTLEQVAEALSIDITTVQRNRKRLLREIHKKIFFYKT